MDAGDVEQHQGIFGFEGEGLRGELERPRNVSQLGERCRAEIVGAHIVRIQVETLFYQLHRASPGSSCFCVHSHGGVGAAEERRRLKILRTQL